MKEEKSKRVKRYYWRNKNESRAGRCQAKNNRWHRFYPLQKPPNSFYVPGWVLASCVYKKWVGRTNTLPLSDTDLHNKSMSPPKHLAQKIMGNVGCLVFAVYEGKYAIPLCTPITVRYVVCYNQTIHSTPLKGKSWWYTGIYWLYYWTGLTHYLVLTKELPSFAWWVWSCTSLYALLRAYHLRSLTGLSWFNTFWKCLRPFVIYIHFVYIRQNTMAPSWTAALSWWGVCVSQRS